MELIDKILSLQSQFVGLHFKRHEIHYVFLKSNERQVANSNVSDFTFRISKYKAFQCCCVETEKLRQ